MRKITAEVVTDSYCSTQYDVRNELGEPSSRADLALSFCEVDEKCRPFLRIGYSMSFEDELIMNEYLHSIEVMSFIYRYFRRKKNSESVFMAGKATFVRDLFSIFLKLF